MTTPPLPLHPEVAADLTIRERLEALDFTRAFLLGATASVLTIWIPLAGLLAAIKAVTS